MSETMQIRCDSCGQFYGIGEWPYCPHGAPRGMHSFTPYVDEHISTDGKPVEITSWAQKRRLMREHWQGDFKVRVEEREPRPRGWLSARIDKERERRKHAG